MAWPCARPLYFLLISSSFGRVVGQCYYPGSKWAEDQYYCDPHAYTTLCCPEGWTCFTNGLCIVTDVIAVNETFPAGTAIRGTCTNPFWNNTVCGDFCLDDPVSENNGSLKSCGGDKWCCGPAALAGTCDCDSGNGVFSVSKGVAQTIIGISGLERTSTDFSSSSSLSRFSSAAGKTTSSKISSASSTSASASITKSSQSKSTTASTVFPSSKTLGQNIPSAAPIPVTERVGFKVGVGVAVSLVFLAVLSAGGLFLWRKWKRRRTLEQMVEERDASEVIQPPPISPISPIAPPSRGSYQYSSPSPPPRGGSWNNMRNNGNTQVNRVGSPFSGIQPYEGT